MRATTVLAVLCCLASPAIATAQAAPGQEPGPAAGAAAPAAPSATSPAPFDPEAATEAYLATVPPDKRARSDAYFEGGYWLQLWGFLLTLGVAWLLLGTRLSARMRDLAERIIRFRPVQVWIYSVLYLLLTTLLVFPWSYYKDFVREHQYGLATQDFGGWLGDQAKGLMVGLILMPLFLVLLYWILRLAPRAWWILGSVLALVFLAFVVLIWPVYISPIFNKYEPLRDASLRESILAMARANGVPADEVYQFDASRQTTRISANVSGLAGTMRVSLNDNLLERTSRPEIEAVMGHEMGHYVLNHVYEGIVEIGVILVLAFAWLRFAFERARRWRGERWGVRGVDDPAGLPLLAVLLAVFFFVLTPINNTIIRSNEAEADIFGLNASRQPEGFAEVALKLGEYRKLAPGPIEEWVFFDHPSGRNRILMAMRWKAEQMRLQAEPPEASVAAMQSEPGGSATAPPAR
jgi:STE24 endopeptidase